MHDRLPDAVMFTQAHLLSRLVDIKGNSSNQEEIDAIRDALVQLRILQQERERRQRLNPPVADNIERAGHGPISQTSEGKPRT